MELPNNKDSHGPVLLGQAGRDSLVGFVFQLEAPWKACRLCGSVYQSDLDRQAYKLQQDGEVLAAAYINEQATQRRQRWEKIHNRREHPNYFTEVRQLELSGLPVTPDAARRLSTYGIIPIGPTTYEDEIADALFSAPRAPYDDPGNSVTLS